MINTLFGGMPIPTVSYNDGELINWILQLHNNSQTIELDPTYSIGNFYKYYNIPEPKYKFDLEPQKTDVTQADCCNLPIDKESIKSIMFDPPFVVGGKPKKDKEDYANVSMYIQKRFSGFSSIDELKNMYADSLKEFYRIMEPNGLLIFKCQDIVVSHGQFFSHCWIFNQAIELGFTAVDLFILVAKNRLFDHKKQYHARKYHCYYWVFRKYPNKADYSLIYEDVMPDMTKCSGEGCSKKNACYRYTSPISMNQSWFANPPFKVEDGQFQCNDIWRKYDKNQFQATFANKDEGQQ